MSSTPIARSNGAWCAAGFILAVSVAHQTTLIHSGTLRWLVVHLAAAIVLTWWAWQGQGPVRDGTTLGIAIVLAWAAVSLGWSEDWRQGLAQWLNLASAAVVFSWLRLADLRLVRWALAAAIVVAIGFAIVEPRYFAGFGAENPAAEWFVLAGVLAWGRWTWPASLLAAGYLVGFNESKIELVALVAALGIGAWALWRTKQRDQAVTVLSIAAIAVMVTWYARTNDLMWSVLDRMLIWEGAVQAFAAAPLSGHGFGSFAYAFGNVSLGAADPKIFVGSAHNELLQIAVEFGMVGLAGLGLAFLLFMARVRFDIAALAALIAVAAASMVSMPLHYPATIALALVVVARLGEHVRERFVPCRFVLVRACLVVVGAAIAAASISATAAQVNFSAVPALAKNHAGEAWQTAQRAYRMWPYDARNRRDLFGLALNAGVSRETALSVYAVSRSAGRTRRLEMLKAEFDLQPGV